MLLKSMMGVCKCLLEKGGKQRPICRGNGIGQLQEMPLHNVELKRFWGLVIPVNEQSCVHLGMEQKNFYKCFSKQKKKKNENESSLLDKSR